MENPSEPVSTQQSSTQCSCRWTTANWSDGHFQLPPILVHCTTWSGVIPSQVVLLSHKKFELEIFGKISYLSLSPYQGRSDLPARWDWEKSLEHFHGGFPGLFLSFPCPPHTLILPWVQSSLHLPVEEHKMEVCFFLPHEPRSSIPALPAIKLTEVLITLLRLNLSGVHMGKSGQQLTTSPGQENWSSPLK